MIQGGLDVVARLRDKLFVVFLSDQISKFWLNSLVSSLRTETLSRAQRGKFFKYSCFSFVLNCFLSEHGRAQRRKFLTPFCLLKYVLLYFHVFFNESGRAQRGKIQNAAVRSL